MDMTFSGQIARIKIENGIATIVVKFGTSEPTGETAINAPETSNLKELEKLAIVGALQRNKKMSEAANSLGINLSSLWRKRKLYGLN